MPITLYDLDHLHTIEQAANRLHVGRTTLKTLIRNEEIGVVRIGTGRGRVFITERSMLDYLNRHYVKSNTEQPRRGAPRTT